MSRHRSFKSLVAILLAAGLLAACAGAFQAQYPITRMVPPDGGLMQFHHPMLRGAAVQRVSHLGAFEHVEYARFETPELVLEAVYDRATSVKTVLQYDYWMARMTETWNLNKGQPKTWGPERTVRAWHGAIEYQPYELSSVGRGCVAFNSEWDYQPLDMFGRPTRVFFGYVCVKSGRSIPVADVAALLASVRFDQGPAERLVPVNAHRSVDPAAYAAAKGTPGGQTGNAAFPFDFGTVYVEGGPERTG